MVAEIADVVLPDDLVQYVVRPTFETNARQMVLSEKGPEMREFQASLTSRMRALELKRGPPQKGEDNILVIASDGRKAAIDMRLIDPEAPNDPGSKLNLMIDNVYETWRKSKNQPFHLPAADGNRYDRKPVRRGPATQIVFAQLGHTTKGGFSVSTYFFEELARRGVPRGDMANIKDYKTNLAKKRLYNDVNDGRVRILFGSPEALGTGVNVQRRLLAAHNLDALWFPALDEQRVGRILRQGNMNPEIQVYDYAMKGTYDSSMWQMMARKGEFIESFWRGDDSVRVIEDVGMASYYEQAKAQSSGDPRLQQVADLNLSIKRLENERISHERGRRRLKDEIRTTDFRINSLKDRATGFQADILKRVDTKGDAFAMEVKLPGEQQGTTETKRSDAGNRLDRAVQYGLSAAKNEFKMENTPVGSVGGFPLVMRNTKFEWVLGIATGEAGAKSFVVDFGIKFAHGIEWLSGEKGSGVVASAEATLRNLEKHRDDALAKATDLDASLPKLKKDLKRAEGKFPKEAELVEKHVEKRNLEASMAAEVNAQRAAENEQHAPEDQDVVALAKRRRGRDADSIGRDGVQEAVASIVSRWQPPFAPGVLIVESVMDLPPRLRSIVMEAEEGGASVDGIYGNGISMVYLISDRISSPEQARRVLAHEAIGHFGLMDMLGDEYGPLLSDVLALVERDAPAVRKYAEQVRKNYPEEIGEDEFAAEVLAHMAEDGVRHPVVHRFIAAVRRFLRGLGVKLAFSYSEVQDMIARAHSRMQSRGHQRPRADTTRPFTGEDIYLRRREGEPSPATRRQRRFLEAMARRRFKPMDRMMRMLFAPVMRVNEQGEWIQGKRLSQAARRVIRDTKPDPNGRFAWLNPHLETFRAGWLNRYGVDREFIQAERAAQYDKARMEQEAVGIIEGLHRENLTPAESIELQKVLEGEPLNDARLAKLAAPVRQRIDELGQELVRMGHLHPDTYAENLGKYLHRSYVKYEAEGTSLQKWLRKRAARQRSLKGDELRMRGERHPVARQKLMRDIPKDQREQAGRAQKWLILEKMTDAGRIARRVYWPENMAVPQEFTAPGWNQRATGWELVSRKMEGRTRTMLRRDWTPEEREQMGEIRNAQYNILKTFQLLSHDIATGRFYEDIAANPDWFSANRPDDGSIVISAGESARARTYAGIGWVHVPDSYIPGTNTKKFGALAGGYIKAPLWRDMNEMDRMMQPGLWRDLVRVFKASKTSLTPTVHFYNTIGNFFLSDMHDLTWSDIALALDEWIAKGDLMQEAEMRGVFNMGFARRELNRKHLEPILKDIMKQVEADRNTTTVDRVMTFGRLIYDKMGQAYAFEDELFRLASYMRDRSQGMHPDQASEYAIDRFMNYDIRAPWPNFLRQFLLPFFSYTYAGVPTIANALTLRPWKLAKLFILGYVVGQIGYLLTDSDEDEHRELLSERDQGFTWAGLPRVMRVPFTDKHGDPVDLELTRFLPGGGFLNTEFGQSGLPEWLLIGGPVSIGMDLYMNRQAWSGEDIVNREIDSHLTATEKRLFYAWRAMVPNWPIPSPGKVPGLREIPGMEYVPGAGTWSAEMLERAMSDERDIFGRQYSVPMALLRTVGLKVRPFDPEYQRLLRGFDVRRIEKEWQQYMFSASKDFNRGRITRATFHKRMLEAQEGMRKAREKMPQ